MSTTRDGVYRGGDITLSVQYFGPDGLAKDADSTPKIQIKDVELGFF